MLYAPDQYTAAPTPQMPALKIVYVEDNLNNQRLLQRMLSRRNVEISFYDNAEDGYIGIRERKPDMIFLDVHLKTRTTGLDLARKLRAGGCTAPMIAVTIFNMLADRKRALEAGCNDFLLKPFQMKELNAIVDRYVETRQDASST
jgi:CheY-like chemotaxis protein